MDTGASVTLLSSAVYKNIAADRRPALQPDCQCTHIEVDKLVPIDGMMEFPFETSGQRFRWRTLVAPIRDDELLGLDFLCAHDFQLGADEGLSLREQAVDLIWKGKCSPIQGTVLPPTRRRQAKKTCASCTIVDATPQSRGSLEKPSLSQGQPGKVSMGQTQAKSGTQPKRVARCPVMRPAWEYGGRSCNGYQEGDAVFTLNTVKMWGRSPGRKVHPWKGPFIIACRLSDTMFEVSGYS